MKLLARLKEWLFYGHVWIALAAAGLGWLSLELVFPYATEPTITRVMVPIILFLGTFGVYTLHRLLSFRKAKALPATKRYRLVSAYPGLALGLGFGSLMLAGSQTVVFFPAIWPTLLCAGFFTVFYLIPPFPGYRRLRDLPYVKVIWVAVAWTLITHDLPIRIIEAASEGGQISQPTTLHYVRALEYLARFLFILAIALLFDRRDVDLDRSQGVRTVANSFGERLPLIVALLLGSTSIISLGYARTDVVPDPVGIALCLTYLLCIPVARLTGKRTDEDWYAIVVNGLLLLPPTAALVARLFS